MVPKQTISCFLESIGCFGSNSSTSFQSFLKTSKYKQLVVLTQFENILLSQRLRMPMLQIRSRGGLQHSNYPRTILNQHSNKKHNQGFNILQRVWILQSLNTTWFNTYQGTLILFFQLMIPKEGLLRIRFLVMNSLIGLNGRRDFDGVLPLFS